MAKLITVGPDRDAALHKMTEALRRCRIDGIPTTLSLHEALLASAEFRAGGVDTGWLGRWLESRDRHRDQRVGGELSRG